LKRKDVFKYLRSKHFEIYCLQDVHWDKKWENMIRAEWGYECVTAGNTTNSRGVAVLFNSTFEFKLSKVEKDKMGNWIALDINVYGMNITLICLYGPNDDKPEFYEEIERVVNNYANPHCVICGDFNLVQDPDKDTFNYINVNNPRARAKILNLMESFDLCDPWRISNPEKKRFTWRRVNPIKQARLDFFLCSSEILNFVQNSDILPGYKTDHSLVVLNLKCGGIKHGKGSWKFNNSLLEEPEYIETIKDSIRQVKELYCATPYNFSELDNIPHDQLDLMINDQLFFEVLLLEIRGVTIAFSSRRKNNQDKTETNLKNKIQVLENELEEKEVSDPNSDVLQNLRSGLKEANSELEQIREKKLKGSFMRSKALWIEQGEKPTKYFCNLEKRNFVNKQISRIEKANGTQATTQEEIMNEVRSFYENLYKSKENELDVTIRDDLPIRKLSMNESNALEGKITQNELNLALKNMKNNKSPGSDGFTVEFYKTFWSEIGSFLLRSINYGFLNGNLSVSQKLGYISLLPKGNKPREFIGNWRPISLLNVSYKLASACISNRIKTVLPVIINEDQTGFVANRFIGENIRLIYDILTYTEINNIPGMLLLIDFEKAFDTVSHDFIRQTLRYFNFGTDICRWFDTFYNDITSSVIVNGHISKSFKISTGCRQGDPMSPYIFVLCAEILASMIRCNELIKGIVINDMSFKLSQYADDTTLMLDGSLESLENAMRTLIDFKNMSGLKINVKKTSAVWIGLNKNKKKPVCEHLKLNWKFDGVFDMLGITFSTNTQDMIDINFNKALISMKNLILSWSKRNITSLGRVVVVKSLVLAKLNYIGQMLPGPGPDFIKMVNDEIYKFVWQGKPDKVKRAQMNEAYESGGVKMPNVDLHLQALRSSWIRRVAFGEQKWKKLFYLLTNVSRNDILTFSASRFEEIKTRIKNKFWYDVLASWSQVIYHFNNQNVDYNSIARQYLWWNDKIIINRKSIHYKHWSANGVRFVKDLLDENGGFKTFDSFQQTYGIKTNFIEYYGIIHAIENGFHLKNTCKKLEDPVLPIAMDLLKINKKGCRIFYVVLLKAQHKKHVEDMNKWKLELQEDFTEERWKDFCALNFNFTNDVKLRWFQYRILHRILGTNDLLYKMNKRINDLCTFCKEEKETLSHLFVKCHISSRFWIMFQSHIQKSIPRRLHFTLTPIEILFGSNSDPIRCLIIVLGKHHIYKSKMTEKKPDLTAFKQELKYYYNAIKYTATCNLEIQKFNKRWEGWSNMF